MRYNYIHEHAIIPIVWLVKFIGVKLNYYIHEHETIPIDVKLNNHIHECETKIDSAALLKYILPIELIRYVIK